MSADEAAEIMREVQELSPGSDHRQQVISMLDLLHPVHRKAWEDNNPDWEKKLDEIFVDP